MKKIFSIYILLFSLVSVNANTITESQMEKEFEAILTFIGQNNENFIEGQERIKLLEKKIILQNNPNLLISFNYQKSIYYIDFYDYKNAHNSIIETIKLCRKQKNYRYLGLFYELLAVYYDSVGNINLRYQYSIVASKVLEKHAPPIDNIDTNSNLAYIYYTNKDWEKVITYSLKSLAYQKSSNEYRQQNILFIYLGYAYLNKGQLDLTAHYLTLAKNSMPEMQTIPLFVGAYYKLNGEYLLKKQNYYESAISLDSASKYFHEFSVKNRKQVMNTMAMRSKYEQTELKLKKIEKETALNKLETKYKTNLLLFSLVISSLLFIVIAILYKTYRYKTKMLEVLNQKNNELNILNIKLKNANASKRGFLDNITHELRTPLNTIKSISILMQKQPDASVNEYSKMLNFSSEYLLNMVNNIISFSSSNDEKVANFEVVNLKNFATELIETFKLVDINQNKIELNYDESIPKNLIVDKFKLNQIIFNLLDNAIKFTQKGTVLLQISAVSAINGSAKVKFQIIDTGKGIHPDNLMNIFKEFFQEKSDYKRSYDGSGLGLYIVKKGLENLNSKPYVHSEIDRGTEVSFEIKFKVSTKKRNETDTLAIEELDEINILLVEDNKLNQTLAKKIINIVGFKCDVADNGQIAVDMFKANHYDLILMDIMMPVMDGFEASKKIKEMAPDALIVALTALDESENKEKFIAAGIEKVLNKPIDIEEIRRIIFKVLESEEHH